MKGNKINGILWILIGVFLTCIMIRGINGKDWRNLKFWSWHIGPDTSWDSDEYPDSVTDEYLEWTFDGNEIENIEIEVVSSAVRCFSSSDTDSIKVQISNNVDVKKYYNVGLTGKTLNVKRKTFHSTGITNAVNTSAKEVIVTIPVVLFDKISIENVSGRIELSNLLARKVNIESVSGKIIARNIEGKVKIENVSGKIEYSVGELKNNIEIESVSGKIKMALPEESDFICSYETVSGSVKSDFKKHGKKSGEIVNGSEKYEIQLETVSGGIEVNSK